MEYWLIPSSKLLWSITSSISNLWRQLLLANVVYDNIFLQWSQGDNDGDDNDTRKMSRVMAMPPTPASSRRLSTIHTLCSCELRGSTNTILYINIEDFIKCINVEFGGDCHGGWWDIVHGIVRYVDTDGCMFGKAPWLVWCWMWWRVSCGRKHVSVGLYGLRHMYTHNTSLHRNTFYKKGRISMRTDR